MPVSLWSSLVSPREAEGWTIIHRTARWGQRAPLGWGPLSLLGVRGAMGWPGACSQHALAA